MVETPAAAHGSPFLVARGRRKGYRVLLVPDFLADRDQHGLLAEALSGGPSPTALAQVQKVAVPGTGPVCCAYRTERVGETDSAGASGQGMLDEHGRPLEILYGVLCATPGVLEPDPADLEVARAEALATYRRFLADETGFTPERSHSLVLRSRLSPGVPSEPARSAPLQLRDTRPGSTDESRAPMSPPPSRSGLVLMVLAVLGIVLAAGAAWALLLRSPGGRVVDVRVEQPQVTDLACGRSEALRVYALLETDGGARVAFHWEDRLDDWRSDRREVTFDREGTREVDVSRDVEIDVGETLSGSIALVVEEPNTTSDTVEYTLSCDEP